MMAHSQNQNACASVFIVLSAHAPLDPVDFSEVGSHKLFMPTLSFQGQNRHSPIVQSQNHHPGMIERHSPLVVQQRIASPVMHSMSPVDHGPSVVMHSNSSNSSINMADLHGGNSGSSMLKVTYEKQTPNRLSALHHDDDNSRRSR